jgi:hypothetical protein
MASKGKKKASPPAAAAPAEPLSNKQYEKDS